MRAFAHDTVDWSGGDARFCTTQWTVVLAAGSEGPRREAALEGFCRTYWYPIYAFIRRHGSDPEEARDLTQAFFEQLLEKGWLSEVERRDTRFSTLLLTIVKRFVATHRRDTGTLKRGGNATVFSLDFAQAEEWFGAEPACDETPEKIFARRWALAVMEAAHTRLKSLAEAAGKAAQFTALSPFLAREPEPGEYQTLSVTLGSNANALAAAVHRLRQQYREALREELGSATLPASEVEADLRHLAEALS